MKNYTKNGGVIPSKANKPKYQISGKDHYAHFGISRGWVKKTVYKDDPENISGELEYVVNIKGRDYYGVRDITNGGGIFHNRTKVRHDAKTVEFPTLNVKNPYPYQQDGECVWVMFIDGNGDHPIIVGSDPHPRLKENLDYKEPTKANGIMDRYEFNGLEFLIDKNSNLTIKHLGRKNALQASLKNPLSVENVAATTPFPSLIQYKENGDFTFTIGELTVEFIKSTGTFNVNAKAAVNLKTPIGSIKLDANGIKGETSTNSFEFKTTGEIDIKNAGGELKFDASGKLKVQAATEEVLSLLSEIADMLSTCTAAGFGAPLSIAASATALKARIDLVKA